MRVKIPRRETAWRIGFDFSQMNIKEGTFCGPILKQGDQGVVKLFMSSQKIDGVELVFYEVSFSLELTTRVESPKVGK